MAGTKSSADEWITTAVVLAGGRGSRLGGVDKGWQLWRGRPLVEQVVERLLPQVDRLIISCNCNLARYRELGYPCVTDTAADFAGPIAGVAAAAALVDTPVLLLCPCDTPLLPCNLAARLHPALAAAEADIAIPVQDGNQQYSHALMTTDFARSAPAALASGVRALRHWYALGSIEYVAFPTDDSFRNINRQGDLE
jgi:molybdenum cofactor guanylyltransferase